MTVYVKTPIRKGLFLLAALALLSLAGPVAKPAQAYCEYIQCLFYPPMHSTCFGVCVCDCPIDPSGDVTDPSNCAMFCA